MTPETIFRIISSSVCRVAAVLRCVRDAEAEIDGLDGRATRLATLHSFRFFGLVFILPGVVGTLPGSFARFAAYGDLQRGCWPSRVTRSDPSSFRALVVAFNIVGAADILIDYYHATVAGLPFVAGQLGAAYAIPVLYVPLLMITHGLAFYLLLRPQR